MNILFYLHRFPGFGGIEGVVATLAKEFVRRGHSVSVLSHFSGDGTSDITQLPTSVQTFTLPDRARLVSRENRAFVRELVARQKIDVVLFQDSYAPIEGNVVGCGLNVPVVTVEHSEPFFCQTEAHPELYTFWRRVARAIRHGRFHLPYYYEGRRKRFLYDNSALYVLLSTRFYGEFKAMARLFDSRKLRAVSNPIAPELIPAHVDLDAKEDLMVFAATLADGKGVMRALEALRILRDSGRFPSGWRIQILGDGPERGACEVFVRRHRLDFVELRGYEANPQPFFARAKILLAPSSREGLPLVLFEAQANGCVPVAFSSYASVFDIVHAGEDGLLVDAFDLGKYADAVHALVSDAAKWRAMAQAATLAADRFAVNKIADQWENLVKGVVRW